jgi:hypothetical protein
MRMMLSVTFPTAKFNELWRKGEVGPKIQQILQDIKPEAAYFGKGNGGQRGVVVIVDVSTAADIPRFTEPWYLMFEATVEVCPCMSVEDIAKVDYQGLASKYA